MDRAPAVSDYLQRRNRAPAVRDSTMGGDVAPDSQMPRCANAGRHVRAARQDRGCKSNGSSIGIGGEENRERRLRAALMKFVRRRVGKMNAVISTCALGRCSKVRSKVRARFLSADKI